ncbi:CocE/NonD family hydrolase [Limnoglobus roseus]|uniref:X-Pro dipeptidyl-peptidase n=1 Tax=Limnoglobus roseus TaxID=2598579 RepID=A0A5C1AD41_9BACT|nr:CocE/NonD family hydrolase [Limnoglobus roseus]QEL16123.1 X-Pro dipeptidyl-peptidase [Limnoglobus roseus]
MFRSLALVVAMLTPTMLFADPLPTDPKLQKEYVVANYTKYEYRVPMRDGVKLFTAVYVPKDDAKKYPMLMNRTPYSVAPYGVENYRNSLGPSFAYAADKFIFVYQDVRGCWMSEGTFVNMRPIKHESSKDTDESTDTYDTVEWLVKNVPNNNGNVGQTGISYPGHYTAAGMIDAHPAMKACSPQAPVTDWFVGDDFHHNGCLFLPHGFNFLAGFGKPRPEPVRTPADRGRFDHGTPDGYEFFLNLGPLANADKKYFKGQVAFWNEMMEHGTYDEFWKAKNIRQHLKNVKPAVMTVGGWFDAENLFGALECYKNTEKGSPENKNNTLVMGPWDHGGWNRGDGSSLGNARFGSKTAEFYREKIELPFFKKHLKGEGEFAAPEAWVFESGTNVWRKYDAWPPKESKEMKYYFQEGSSLLPLDHRPGMLLGGVLSNQDEFVSDPAKPVPFIERTSTRMDYEYMTADQRFASRRPDVLVYQTPELTEDLTLAGPIDVELHVSTTGTDADWIVKVVDVFPADYPDADPNPAGVKMGGYQMLIRGEPFRGKFRNSFSKPEAFEPGKPTTIKFTMPDICHTFRPGHKLMVQVQSTWFPLLDRNPQTFCDIYHATEKDFVKATHTVYRSPSQVSGITVRLVK